MKYHSRTTTLFMLMLVVAVLPLASCGGSTTPAAVAGSCNNVASGMCMEYTGADYQVLTMQRLCESQKSTYLIGACPTEGLVGSCLWNKGKRSEVTSRYYTTFPGFGVTLLAEGVAAAGEEQCTMVKGEWTLN